MKKMLLVLAIAGMVLVSCSKEELNKLQAENATLTADKAALETQLQTVTQEKDAAKAEIQRMLDEQAAAAAAAAEAAAAAAIKGKKK